MVLARALLSPSCHPKVPAGMGTYLAALGKHPLPSSYRLLADVVPCVWRTGVASPCWLSAKDSHIPWHTALPSFSQQQHVAPFLNMASLPHLHLPPSRKNSAFKGLWLDWTHPDNLPFHELQANRLVTLLTSEKSFLPCNVTYHGHDVSPRS